MFRKLKWMTTLALAVSAGAATAHAGTITIKGSDTMVVLAQRWAEAYMAKNKSVKIAVTGGGSGTGLAALINGTVSMANASRPMRPNERQQIMGGGNTVTELKVAMDALAVVTHQSNPIKVLTLRQLKGVYTGQIRDWREVGGKPGRIVRYCREANSGTYAFFKEHVLDNADFAADCQTLPGTAAVANAVARDKSAIGFGGIGYFAHTKGLNIPKIAYVAANLAIGPIEKGGKVNYKDVWTRRYPLARFLYMYKAGALNADETKYIKWILSPEGQKIVEKVDYVPMPKK